MRRTDGTGLGSFSMENFGIIRCSSRCRVVKKTSQFNFLTLCWAAVAYRIALEQKLSNIIVGRRCATMVWDRINETITYVMRVWNVGVLRRVRLSNLVIVTLD